LSLGFYAVLKNLVDIRSKVEGLSVGLFWLR